MKKIIIATLALTLAGSAAFAQTTNAVLSRNAVGYVKIDVPTNKFAMVGPVFQAIGGGSQTLGEIVGSNGVPASMQIFYWNPNAQTYAIATFDPEDGWTSAATNVVPAGRGFFLKAPANTNFAYYLMGEVPDATNRAITGTGGGGFNQFAYMYPVARAFSNLTIATQATASDQISVWNVTSQTYTFYTYDPEDGWPPALMSRIMQPGEAFFYKDAGTAVVWNETKPYTWP